MLIIYDRSWEAKVEGNGRWYEEREWEGRVEIHNNNNNHFTDLCPGLPG